jgi:hypothetical protein
LLGALGWVGYPDRAHGGSLDDGEAKAASTLPNIYFDHAGDQQLESGISGGRLSAKWRINSNDQAPTGVNGRPTRACAPSTGNEKPSDCLQTTEPETPQATAAAIQMARARLTCFTMIFQFLRTSSGANKPGHH